MEHKCKDCGEPADPEQTMDFSDIGKHPLYWCTKCGVKAHSMSKLLQEAFKKPGFKERFAKEVYKYNN